MFSAKFKFLISRYVNVFELPVNTEYTKEAWAKDLGEEISEDSWNESLEMIQDCSMNSRHRFKVLHRLHYSKTKLSKIYNPVSTICDRCKTEEGSLSHMFLVLS